MGTADKISLHFLFLLPLLFHGGIERTQGIFQQLNQNESKVEEEAYAQAKEKTKEDACKVQVSPSTSPILILDQPWTSPQGLVKDLFCTKNRQYLVCQKLTVFAFYV